MTTKYPMAGDLLREQNVELTANPYEVRTRDGGLEGAFARSEDAEGYADELRRIGAVGVTCEYKPRRPLPTARSRELEGNPQPRMGTSSVQSLLFPVDKFSAAQAKAWAKSHGYIAEKVHSTTKYHRIRQFTPTGHPCRTIAFGKGIRAVICQAKPASSKSQLRAGGPMRQSNPPRKFGEGTRVIFRPDPSRWSMYEARGDALPPRGAVGTVRSKADMRYSGQIMAGGPWIYVDFDLYPVMAVAPGDLEVDQVVERAKRIAAPSRHGREEGQFDSDILDGMARAIWVSSWANWAEENSVKLRGDLDKAAPETPESAVLAAEDVYLMIERANGKTPGELFQRACQVDGCAWSDRNAHLFGHYLAMQAMGHGVSWFDDHKEFPLKFPRYFEALSVDGESVDWSPQVRMRENGDSR